MAGIKMCMVYLLINAVLLPTPTGASVSVTTDSDLGDKEWIKCNSKTVVTCSIQPYSIMTWTIDDNVVADCTFDSCNTYITGGAHYGFAFDKNNGIFNITMDPVTFADNEKTFKCDDGNEHDILVAKVHVIPDSSGSTISISKKSQSIDIMATTGCIYPSSNIQFEWYFFKDGQEPELYNESRSLQSTNEFGCTSKPCGGKGVVKVTSTLTIQEDPDGDNYYFQVLIKHPDTTDIIVRAENQFKLKGNGDQIRETSQGTSISIHVSTVMFSVIVIMIYVFL
ncbi:uncharacterized protein LOC132758862 [Ruditapes philippinarum]|uniref:uncharacterized protein LOC132758862 n=1 Tax=Ruditapes philippinarum TaxID=129788 RepID=UPI00295B8304|nr:uncharacterized protein LOC132758862 [Ruditapes philippinarum]XP_060606548.1 uncharacterized protein LOC132758862 [Ruditapes philippinarum]XP_060606549.1 uncharacterized protein LOC132758862 [Ruditapes philippinarum]XP_060606550.1 uncharacterized protein LOC132758862 [Ruditapes philippinarum]XP_060606551.1 uncharacterized protein LOC132758862 [Ruditapes philippinarum]